MLEDQTSTSSWYVGSKTCSGCHELISPVEALYSQTLCPRCTRLAQRRLVANKRVGDL